MDADKVEYISVHIRPKLTILFVREPIEQGYTYYVRLNGRNCKPQPPALTRAEGKQWYNDVIGLFR